MLPLDFPDEKSLMLYKLIVLYIIDNVDFPLTRVQIAGFMEEKKYLGYLPLQKVFADLAETGLVTEEKHRGRTIPALTDEGREVLQLFHNEITAEIKKDIDDYLKSNALMLHQKTAVTADYQKSADGGYISRLKLSEHGNTLLDVSVSFPTEDMAENACRKWDECHEDIYSIIMSRLMS